MGWYNKALYSGGFGLGQTIWVLFFQMIIIIHSENFGIFLTEKYSKGDWKGMQQVFLRGLGVKSFIVLFNCLWLCYTKPVLIFLNFDPELVDVVSEVTFAMIPS